jgi:XapX domain-containing protein
MMELKSFLTATAFGFAFGAMKLPIPAPISFAGVLGVVGVFLGYRICQYWGIGE